MYTFNEADIQAQVLDFISSVGIKPLETLSINSDGNIHRFSVEGDRGSEKAGAYCIFSDGWPAGWIKDWRLGVTYNWSFTKEALDDEGKNYFSDSEAHKEMLRRSEEHKKKLQAELAVKQNEAIIEARSIWKRTSTTPTDGFPYLEIKHVSSYGGIKLNQKHYTLAQGGSLTHYEAELIIPLKNINGDIQTLQFIQENGNKRFLVDAPVKGAFFAIDFWDKPIHETLKNPVIICEGYATAATLYSLTHLPTIAAMNSGNIKPVAEALKAKFPEIKLIIMADNDWQTESKRGFNPGLKAANEAMKELDLLAVIYPPFTPQDFGSDWNDYEAIYGSESTARLLMKEIVTASLPPYVKEAMKKVTAINAQDLRHKKFDPINWAIDGFIPSGLTVLAGGPKVGKSLLALHIALGVAIGGTVLGKIDVEKGNVLYYALEDTERRLQERILGSGIDDNTSLENLTLATSAPRQDEGGLDAIRGWLLTHKDAKLVIIDTLQKFRKQSKGKLNVYAEDYEALSELKKLADEFNVAIIVIHHLKKMSAREELQGDWINQLSGSAGITGCADTILLLKRERVSTHGILRRTGRDVEEKDFNMKLDGFGWYLEGEVDEFAMPAWKQKIVDYLKEHEKITPMLLSDYAHISIEAARRQLLRAAESGIIRRLEHGVYVLNL